MNVKPAVKPDAAMVYAWILLRLRDKALTPRLRREFGRKAVQIRRSLTSYEIQQVRKFLAGAKA